MKKFPIFKIFERKILHSGKAPKWSKQSKTVQNGLKRSTTVNNGQYGQKHSKTVKKKRSKMVKNSQFCQKRSIPSTTVKNGKNG